MKKQTKTILSDSGYILVKKYFNFKDINRTKKDLTVAPYVNQNYSAKAIPFPIFMESKNKLYLPKHYGLENFGDPDVKKIKSKGINISLDFIGDLRDKQINPINAFLKTCSKGSYSSKSKGGIISLPCGYGKTVCALFLIHKLKKKTLVIVHKEFLINQWIERINQFLPEARIGIIQGSKIDVNNKDIVIGMLQSISMKEYSWDIFKDFGFVIFDECHHLGAEVFSRALPKVNSYYSLGLSATPKRKDGLSKVFHWFLGPLVYEIKKREDYPVIVNVIKYKCNDEIYNKQEITNYGKICMPKMINNITKYRRRVILVIEIIKKLRKKNKKILILSDRRQHLKDIYCELEKINIGTFGYYVGGMKQKELKLSEKNHILLGTFTMASEGMDIPDLDSVIFASPKSDIRQSIGRILRKKHEEMPIAWDIVDDFSVFSRQFNKRKAHYRKMKYKINEYHLNDDPNKNISHMIKNFNEIYLTK